MISKQIKLIIALVAAVAVLIAAYFIISPMLSEPVSEKAEFDADGDRLGTSGRPYIYDIIEHDNVEQIFVKNDLDSYTFKMDKVSDSLVLVGGENLSLDSEKLSYLYVCTCNMLAMAKVEDAGDLSEYGLDKGKDGNYFAHTLNNTCVAPPRMLIAFLENNLNADGSVNIPEVLRPYMGGKDKITIG